MLYLYNSLTSCKEVFQPISDQNVTMYVCGPTVYDVPHIGNLRSIVIYDVLCRILSTKYQNVTYVRNITDIDDKIINSALASKKPTSFITHHYTKIFHENASALGCMQPTFEPKATEHIEEMIAMISKIIDNGNAYVVGNNVYFDVSSYKGYAKLSGRNVNEMLPGNRVILEPDKRNVGDFALWKNSADESYMSPWGKGRPGWHIECSAMSTKYLGKNFDIHGGGLDLKFPHHENEIAQSCTAYMGSCYAKYWIHNGFLTVNAEKMSKSTGNVLYLETLLEQGISAELVRYILLSSYYRKPLNWTDSLVLSCQSSFATLKRCLKFCDGNISEAVEELYNEFLSIMYNDLNTPAAFHFLHQLSSKIDYTMHNNHNIIMANAIFKSLSILGFSLYPLQFGEEMLRKIEILIEKRRIAKQEKNFYYADEIKKELLLMDIKIYDNKDGTTSWEYK